jgi:uncharacterized membrane protein
VIYQFLKCLADLFFILLGAIVVGLMIRAVPLIRAIAIRHEYIRAPQRYKMVAVQFGLTLLDICIFIFSVPVLLLSIYRIPVLVRKWRKEDSTWGFEYSTTAFSFSDPKAQVHMFSQAAYFWRDVPFFLMALCVLLSWRVGFYIRGLWRIHKSSTRYPGNERRRLTAHTFGQVLIDIPVIILAAFGTLFLWRSVIMWYEFKHATTTNDKRRAIVRNFFEFFVDLPFALCALVVTVLLWRAFFMWRELYRLWRPEPDEDADKWMTRFLFFKHFCFLFVDLIDAPFAVMSIGIVITGWRLPALYRNLKVCETRNQMRKVVLKELLLWLLDIPTFIACFIVFITIYRAKTMCKALHKHLSDFWRAPPPTARAGHAAPTAAAPAGGEDNPAPAASVETATTTGTWHRIVWANFGLVLLDIPFPLLLLLTLWRLPWCAKRLIKECESARDRRITILKYLILMVFDIPCIILFIPMLLTVWRVPSVVMMIRQLERGDNEHKKFLAIWVQWVIDLPFALMLLWVLLCVWRAPGVLRTLVKRCDAAPARRSRIAQYFGITFLDILVSLLFIVTTLLCPWRIAWFVRKRNKRLAEYGPEIFWRHSFAYYRVTLYTIRSGLADWPFVLLGALMVVFIWRWPFYLRFIIWTKWSERA